MPIHDSTRLIKAQVARKLGGSAAFNFDDLRRQCEEYIDGARRQGQQLLAQAGAEADEIRRRAHAEGVALGRRDALDSARPFVEARVAELVARETQQQLRTVLPAFQAAAEALHVERDRWVAAWEAAAVKLSAAIAGRILRHELSRRPELALPIIREALQLAAGQPQIRLHLNPHDLAQLEDCGAEAVGRLAAIGEATLVPDETIARGGCLVETRHGVIDARLETQLERITSELLEGA
ncbi:MAG: FliH/SctL family protein [Deltaproteobacteria bacterium]